MNQAPNTKYVVLNGHVHYADAALWVIWVVFKLSHTFQNSDLYHSLMSSRDHDF